MNEVGREKAYDKWLKVRQQFAEAYQTRQPSAEASTYSDSASNDSKIRYFTLLPCPLDPVFSQYELYIHTWSRICPCVRVLMILVRLEFANPYL